MLWAAQNRKCTERAIIAGKFVCLFVFDAAQGGKSNKALVLPLALFFYLLGEFTCSIHPTFNLLKTRKNNGPGTSFGLDIFWLLLPVPWWPGSSNL
jgi:hypothetical protein